jgi:hypothetical protein
MYSAFLFLSALCIFVLQIFRLRSCSIPCYKKHQETCGQNAKLAAGNTSGGTAGAAAVPSPAGGQVAVPSASSVATSKSGHSSAAAVSILKAAQPTVAPSDLDNLARSPSILAALSHADLRSILLRIDRGGAPGTAEQRTDDDKRAQMLEQERRTNPDFEKFVQEVLQIINREEGQEESVTVR